MASMIPKFEKMQINTFNFGYTVCNDTRREKNISKRYWLREPVAHFLVQTNGEVDAEVRKDFSRMDRSESESRFYGINQSCQQFSKEDTSFRATARNLLSQTKDSIIRESMQIADPLRLSPITITHPYDCEERVFGFGNSPLVSVIPMNFRMYGAQETVR